MKLHKVTNCIIVLWIVVVVSLFLPSTCVFAQLHQVEFVEGVFFVQYKTITIDGNFDDWDIKDRVYVDTNGPECFNAPGQDMKAIYLAQDDEFIYLRVISNAPQDESRSVMMGTLKEQRLVGISRIGDEGDGEMKVAIPNPDGQAVLYDLPFSAVRFNGNQFECRFRKTDVSIWGVPEAAATLHLLLAEPGNPPTACSDDVYLPTTNIDFSEDPISGLSVKALAPAAVRPSRNATFWLEYTNEGDVDIPAQLFIVYNNVDAKMRLSRHEPFQAGSVQVLGVNFDDEDAGILPPGSGPHRIPIFFKTPDDLPPHFMINFFVDKMTANSEAIDWSEIESEVRPDDMESEAWDVIWATAKAQLGNTWAEYAHRLGSDASYIGHYRDATKGTLVGGELAVETIKDLNLYDVRTFLGFELAKAAAEFSPRSVLATAQDVVVPAPGLPLVFGRIAPQAIPDRFQLGPFGRGWVHIYDYTAERDEDGNVTIEGPDGQARIFYNLGEGEYQGLPGDEATVSVSGDMVVLKEKGGMIWRFAADGKLASLEDANSNTLTLNYVAGNLTSIVHSNGESLTISYDGNGKVQQVTEPSGRSTLFRYDAGNEYLIEVEQPGGIITGYAYHPADGSPLAHALTTITFPDNTHYSYTYDTQGRLLTEEADEGAGHITYGYGDHGTVTITDASNNTTTIRYGLQGEVLEVQDPSGTVTRNTFDGKMQVPQLVGPDGKAISLAYDTKGNLVGIHNPLNQLIQMAYADDGRLTKLTDARSNNTGFAYDDAGNLESITYPDTSVEFFTYDGVGNVSTYTNRRGDTISYAYNSKGQMTQKNYPNGRTMTYQYDERGNMTEAADSLTGTISMEYDDRDFLTRIEYPGGYWFSFQYNDAGLRTQRTSHDGQILNYFYDSAGRLERLTDGSGTDIIRYEYDQNGRLETEFKGNGTQTTYDYDEAGQLVNMVNYSPGGAVQSRFDYTYDANGNRKTMTTLDGTTYYDYDDIGQLVGVTYPGGGSTTYQYDPAGNRISVTDNGVTTNYSTNNMDQYTQVGDMSYTYDADGNMISKTDSTGTTTYAYDAENRLIRVENPAGEIWEYSYDALGNRIAVGYNGIISRYVHDPAGLVDIAAEYDGSGTLMARYTYGMGLVNRLDGTGDEFYYSFDGIGHTRQLTDTAGIVVNTYDYSPFGIPLHVDETVPNIFRYIGRLGIVDEKNGLKFMRMRYYDADLGKFGTKDPIGIVGGANLYLYVNNDPVNRIDPEGKYEENIPSYGKINRKFVEDWCAKKTGIPGFEKAWGIYRLINATRTFVRSALRKDSSISERVHATGVFGAKLLLKNVKIPFIGKIPFSGRLVDLYDRISYDIPYKYPNLGPFFHGIVVGVGLAVSEYIEPDDPNEKVGLAGVGDQHYIVVDEELHYVIFFENKETASAAAQEVFIEDYLDPDLDWSTLELGEVAFGDQMVDVLRGEQQGQTRIVLEDIAVDIIVEFDASSGRLFWTLRTLDLETGELPEDVFAGFLPPNDDTGRGEGHVTFTIRPKSDLLPGTVIANSASIVFDTEDAIETNEVINTISSPAPAAPTEPSISDGAVDVAISTSLSWTAPDYATAYDLYLWKLGQPKPEIPTAADLDSASYNPPADLLEGTNYLWQVVAKNVMGESVGMMWSFTTAGAPAPFLFLEKAGEGTGTVSSVGADIDCGNDCAESYIPGTEIVLTATADFGSVFAGWSGGGCSGTDECIVAVNADTTVTATFNMLPFSTVSGAVTTSDGQPLANVCVRASSACGESWQGEGQTDESGDYALEVPIGEYYMYTDASCSTLQYYIDEWWNNGEGAVDCQSAVPITVSEGQPTADVDFSLLHDSTISGTIYQSDGVTPVNEAHLEVRVLFGDPCNIGNLTASTLVDPDGTYVLTGLPAGTYYVYTDNIGLSNYMNEWWTASGSLTECSAAEPVTVALDEPVSAIDFRLELGGEISGTVYQSDGVTPVNEAHLDVRVLFDDPCNIGNLVASPLVNPDGTYTLTGLPAGTYYVYTDNVGLSNYMNEWWTASGSLAECSAAEPVTVVPDEPISEIDFQLELGGGISGTVYQSDGVTPMNEAHLEVRVVFGDPCNIGNLVASTLIRSDGTYTLAGLPAGTYYVYTDNVGLSNYMNEWWTTSGSLTECSAAEMVTVALDEPVSAVDFQLDVGGEISGTVYESDGVTPVNEEHLEVRVVSGDPCSGWTMVGSTLTRSDGTYTLTGLPAGTYYLYTDNVGLSTYLNEWWTASGSVQECASAEPLTIATDDTVSGVDFQLEQVASISGTIYQNDGTPLTGEQFEVWVSQGDPCGDSQRIGLTWTDPENGTYVLTELPMGEYYLRTWNMDQSNYLDEWWTGDSPDPSNYDCTMAQSSDVLAGDVLTDRDFRLEMGAEISGTVRQSDGSPLTGVEIMIDVVVGDPCGPKDFLVSATTNPIDGTYTILGIPAGSFYYLGTWNQDQSNYVNEWWTGESLDPSSPDCSMAKSFDVLSGDVLTDRDFQLELGSEISGIVYQSDGSTPVTDAEVQVTIMQGDDPCGWMQFIESTMTDSSDGTYTITGIPAGTYYLQTDNRGQSNYVNEWWATSGSSNDCNNAQTLTVEPGETASGTDFQLDQGAEISGTVYQNDGSTLVTGVEVQIEVVQGDPCGQRWTIMRANTDPSNGTYTINGMPAGTYSLQSENMNQSDYLEEWWTGASPDPSNSDCELAQSFEVSSGDVVTARNFQLDQGGTISGYVYQNDGVTPIPNLQVFATDYATNQWMAGTNTEQDGSYSLLLPSGTYRVRACSSCSGLSYVDEFYDNTSNYGEADQVTVIAPNDTSGIDFILEEGGTISGTVYESDGVTPIQNFHVFVEDYNTEEWMGGSNTNQNGDYSIVVPAGTYRVRTCSSCTGLNYVDEYYDNIYNWDDATPVTVIAPDEMSNIDFSLEEGATISGTVYENDGISPLTGVELEIAVIADDPCKPFFMLEDVADVEIDPENGTYIITGVPAGTYYLRTFTEGANYIDEWWAPSESVVACDAAESLTVEPGETAAEKNFQLGPGAIISGTVYESDGTTPLTGEEDIGVLVVSGDPCGQQFVAGIGIDESNGTYTIVGVPAGTFYLRTWNEAGYVDEWWTASGSIIDCADAQSLEVEPDDTITDKNFQLGGSPVPTPTPPPYVIPEPATLLLVGTGLLGILALMRRKRG